VKACLLVEGLSEEKHLMLTHIRRHTIGREGTQRVELGGITTIGFGVVTACYTEPERVFHIISGSF
jgi:hypothetical protein